MSRLFLALATTAVLAAGGCTPARDPDAAKKDFNKALADYGFVELRPPSTLLTPGTIVRLKSREPLQAGIVCTQKASLGPDIHLESSSSNDTSVGSLNGAGYALDASVLPVLGAKAEYASVERVQMRLSNVHVMELPDSLVYDAVANRSPGCQKALNQLAKEANQSVSMIKSVLVADVTYGVDFRSASQLDAAAKLSLVKKLGADLGASAETATANSVSGTALYWGAIDEVRLAQVGVDLPVGSTRAATATRALPPTQAGLQIDPTPMAE